MGLPVEWRGLARDDGDVVPSDAVLPETSAVPWRPRAGARRLRTAGRLWTLTTLAHVVPFVAAAALLVALEPLALPVALACLAHAWVIPELYAQRGANVMRPPTPRGRVAGDARAEAVALGLLGDLLDHEARAVQQETGVALEPGRFGTWVVGQGGALLVRPGGRRVLCWCVRADDPGLPAGDRIAHLLLALRTDEAGFATVANLSFSGAAWRVRRRLAPEMRPALDAARRRARLDTVSHSAL